jgi:tetratricopeptide (TPR) repeat protein
MQNSTKPQIAPDVLAAYRLQAAGRKQEAEAGYRAALALRPADLEALALLAQLCRERGALGDALQLHAAMMRAAPISPEPASNHAVVLTELGRPEEALASLERALACKPDFVAGHYNRGNALFALGRYDDALASFEGTLALDPNHVNARYNRGNTLRELRRHDEALAAYADALALAPERADIRVNVALTLLRLGRLAEGFAEYEWRLQPMSLPGAPWRGGSDVAGKTIFLYAEQGLGDTLQFIRYAPLLAAHGARVIAAVPAALKPLIATMPGVTVVSAGDLQPSFDLHCPLMSLPLAFGTTLATVPAAVPYLAASPERIEHWRARLQTSAGLRVGLIWAGNPSFAADRDRSMPFEALAPLVARPGVNFVALQRDLPPRDVDAFAAANLVNLAPEFRDFADAAAVISMLDLVIAVDTAFVHLAGALGKPVWAMLPHSPDYRWMLDRADSPWYPTARLFCQPQRGAWDAVVAAVGAALDEEIASGPAARRALFAAGDYARALVAAERAAAAAPKNAAAHNDCGTALAELGRHDEAHAAFGRAIAGQPAFSAAIFNQGLIDLTRGDYAAGWSKYEERFAANEKPCPVSGPRWTGTEPLDGKTVLVVAEQGFGDTFQFVRYVPLLAGRGANVVLAVPAPIAPALAALEGSPQIVRLSDAVPRHDYAVPLVSLPHAFRTTLDTIPARVPYLAADPERLAYWRGRLPDGPRIGLVWSGTSSAPWAGARSIALNDLAPILTNRSFRFVSLQRHLRPADAAALSQWPDLVHFGDALRDFADTAAIIASVDLVISIDTAVAHLAGAIARPLWVMLPHVADFRWLLGRTDSPWYPTARLFRQSTQGDWSDVIACVARELSKA